MKRHTAGAVNPDRVKPFVVTSRATGRLAAREVPEEAQDPPDIPCLFCSLPVSGVLFLGEKRGLLGRERKRSWHEHV